MAQFVNACLPLRADGVTRHVMFLLAAAATMAASTPANSATPPAVVQARATVRILSGVRLKLDSKTNPDAPLAHDSTVTTNGTRQPAQLIEFQ